MHTCNSIRRFIHAYVDIGNAIVYVCDVTHMVVARLLHIKVYLVRFDL